MDRGEARQGGAFDRDFELIDYRLVERQVFSDLRSLPSFLNKTADLRADDEKSCSRFEETGFGEYPMGKKKKRGAACDRQKFRVASTEGFVCGHHMPPKHAFTSISVFSCRPSGVSIRRDCSPGIEMPVSGTPPYPFSIHVWGQPTPTHHLRIGTGQHARRIPTHAQRSPPR